ncbi:MAG: PorT family protein [Flavobacteriales bacterium]|nr:PorT family protein [Flavobacteriales bacterium]
MRLLRILTTFVFPVFLGHGHVSAQRHGMAIGLKASAGTSTWQAAGLAVKPILSGSLGAYMPLYALRKVEVQPELLLTAMGCELTRRENQKQLVRTAYVQLPLSVKYFVTPVFDLQAGGYAGYLLYAHSSGYGDQADIRDQFRNMDFGLHVGLGLELISGLDFGVRYTQGMTGIWQNDNVVYPMNRWVHGSIGYRFFAVKRSFVNRRRR